MNETANRCPWAGDQLDLEPVIPIHELPLHVDQSLDQRTCSDSLHENGNDLL